MTERATWGSATDKPTGGGDPNVLDLKDATRIRLLEPSSVKWRQHSIDGKNFDGVDDDKFRSCVCPKGADGRGPDPCPLCMKPSDAEGNQRFNISRRFATNVWDYASESVKVLIGGPQVFQPFDEAAKVGIDPTQSDWIIHKTGSGQQTKYKMTRDNPSPGPQVEPGQLHDLDKYGEPMSAQKIFEVLEDLGIDYDSLETPSFTVEQAEAFVLPFGKHKGETVEQVYHSDKSWLEFIHDAKLSDGNTGDSVFLAINTVLAHYGDAEPLDVAPAAPPRPATATQSSTPAPGPQAAPAPTEAVPVANGAGPTEVELVGPDGNVVTVPIAAKDALLASGFTEPQSESPHEPNDADIVGVEISGTITAMPYSAAKALVASGVAKLVTADPGSVPQDPPAEPEPVMPADEDMVQVKLTALPHAIPMAWGDFKKLPADSGKLEDEALAAAWAKAQVADEHADQIRDAARNGEVQESHPSEQASGDPLNPALTVQGEGGRWTHPALPAGKDYATKGAVTQALNRLKAGGGSVSESAPAAAGPAPAADATGREAKLQACKDKMARMPEIQNDFTRILELFQSVAGKRNITDFTEDELDKLSAKLDEMLAAGAPA